MAGFLIRYRYPGTTLVVRGVEIEPTPVGLVYVTHHPELSSGIYSHTYDPARAWAWRTRREADMALAAHRWPLASVEPREDCSPLPDPVGAAYLRAVAAAGGR